MKDEIEGKTNGFQEILSDAKFPKTKAFIAVSFAIVAQLKWIGFDVEKIMGAYTDLIVAKTKHQESLITSKYECKAKQENKFDFETIFKDYDNRFKELESKSHDPTKP